LEASGSRCAAFDAATPTIDCGAQERKKMTQANREGSVENATTGSATTGSSSEELGSIDAGFDAMSVRTVTPTDNKSAINVQAGFVPLQEPIIGTPTVAPAGVIGSLAEQERVLYQHTVPFNVRIDESPSPNGSKLRPGVLGYVHLDLNGARLREANAPSAELSQKLAFVRQLGGSLGIDLGLENLQEVHVVAKDKRSLSIVMDDGTNVDLLAVPQVNTHELAKRIRRGDEGL
jgi:hypothetical protein